MTGVASLEVFEPLMQEAKRQLVLDQHSRPSGERFLWGDVNLCAFLQKEEQKRGSPQREWQSEEQTQMSRHEDGPSASPPEEKAISISQGSQQKHWTGQR
jgi:hypothetical protein